MGILSSLKRRLNYVVVKPLLYHQEVADAYSGVSVVDGKLKGKTVVVTGATGGIGRAIVKRFLLEGCQVIIIGRDIEKLNHLQESFPDQENQITCITMNMQDANDVKEKTIAILHHHSVDVWVNCAGVFKNKDRFPVFRSYPQQDFLEVMNTNLKSCLLICRLIAAHMKANGGYCKVVNISSICGYAKSYGYTGYGMSKAGLTAMTHAMAEEYQEHMAIIGIAPGSVATSMGERQFGDNIAVGGNMITKHIGMPEEIATLVAFVAGDITLSGKTIIASADEIL
jgi:3-oxoacyl-(acyl-carrier protein) reductase